MPSYIDSRITRRRLLKGTAAGAGAAFLIACGGGDGGSSSLQSASNALEPGAVWAAKDTWTLEDETKNAVRGGIYRGVRTGDQSGHFDFITLASSESVAGHHTNEHLMAAARRPGLDPSSVEANTAIPALASAWEFSPDGTSITFTMRESVKWQDIHPINGRVMDIDDWRSTDQRFREVGQYRGQMPSIAERSEFPDDKTMVWKLISPFAGIQELISNIQWTYMVQPKEVNSSSVLAESTIIGTGYKMLDKHQPAIAYEYKKNPEYWGGDPFIDRWHVPIIPEYANRFAQFITGNIQDFTPTARDVLLLADDAPETVIVAQQIPTTRTDWMQFGADTPEEDIQNTRPWADPRVRIAIRRAINFKAIGELESNKVNLEAAGIPIEILPNTHVNRHPGFWLNPEEGEYDGDLNNNFLFNVAEAKKLIAAAGFGDAPIPMNYYVQATQGEIAENNKLVLDSLKDSGIFDLNVVLSPNRRDFRERRAFLRADGFIAQVGHNAEVDRIVYRQHHSQGNAGRSDHSFPTAEIDALIIKQRQTIDVEARWGVLKDLQHVLAAHMGQVPGRHNFTTLGFRWPWLHNIGHGEPAVGSNSPPRGRPFLGGHLQWLDKDMPNRDTPI